ncbi:carbamoylphosphate synthase large subunit [Thiomicrospira aerophila AL3]|uniref:Carbamoylphosphate synthase large subunit n=2 Tax=Thiomicrospira aerophila TaxID=92245 RepID=W0DXI4_9GAMM|nr:carbamoylphosphate synthase large subunit [Thiomicrospira aerophila AL3]
MKVLTEASGSLSSGFIINSIKQAGFQAVGSDITEINAGSIVCDDYIQFLPTSDDNLWLDVKYKLIKHQVEVVLPCLDDMLLDWTQQVWLKECNIALIASPASTLSIFLDKWKAYQFFEQNDVRTPRTSLQQVYRLLKPRRGRGGKGIIETTDPFEMHDYISQQKIHGVEYTIDVLCDKSGQPLYILPRKRLGVIAGKSTQGELVNNRQIINEVERICRLIHFVGPVNFQCIENELGVFFIEINPRLASGMALSFAATNNWVEQIINHIVKDYPIDIQPVKWGMKMFRSYQELYVR